MSEEQKERKKRKPKNIIVFESQENGNLILLCLDAETIPSFSSTQGARKWIKFNAEKLVDKTLVIGSMTPEITIKVKTVSKVSFE